MSRFPSRAAAAALLVLVGCPLPQPLPDYPKGQPITPPRIVVDDTVRQVAYPDTVVRVPAGCGTGPVYQLHAWLRDTFTNETFRARWFIDYDPVDQPSFTPQQDDEILGAPAGATDPTLRDIPVFPFRPYQYAPIAGTGGGAPNAAGAVHVVELVVSNGFDAQADTAVPPLPALPYRTPKAGEGSTPPFEVQVYRWVFVTVPESSTVTCPP